MQTSGADSRAEVARGWTGWDGHGVWSSISREVTPHLTCLVQYAGQISHISWYGIQLPAQGLQARKVLASAFSDASVGRKWSLLLYPCLLRFRDTSNKKRRIGIRKKVLPGMLIVVIVTWGISRIITACTCRTPRLFLRLVFPACSPKALRNSRKLPVFPGLNRLLLLRLMFGLAAVRLQ